MKNLISRKGDVTINLQTTEKDPLCVYTKDGRYIAGPFKSRAEVRIWIREVNQYNFSSELFGGRDYFWRNP